MAGQPFHSFTASDEHTPSSAESSAPEVTGASRSGISAKSLAIRMERLGAQHPDVRLQDELRRSSLARAERELDQESTDEPQSPGRRVSV